MRGAFTNYGSAHGTNTKYYALNLTIIWELCLKPESCFDNNFLSLIVISPLALAAYAHISRLQEFSKNIFLNRFNLFGVCVIAALANAACVVFKF